jgi:hypothetical protein|nr:MAG TPA: PgaD-like protein [Caudoviricetes sp.]
MNKEKNNPIVVIIMIILILFAINSFIPGKNKNTNKYSGEYRSNYDYQQKVNEIADTYGITPEEVDRKINSVADKDYR